MEDRFARRTVPPIDDGRGFAGDAGSSAKGRLAKNYLLQVLLNITRYSSLCPFLWSDLTVRAGGDTASSVGNDTANSDFSRNDTTSVTILR